MTAPMVLAQPRTLGEIVQWLHDAVSTKDLGLAPLVSYWVQPLEGAKPGALLWATNGRLSACAPLGPDSVTWHTVKAVLLPAEPIDRFAAKVGSRDAKLTIHADHAFVRSGKARLRVSVTKLDDYDAQQTMHDRPMSGQWGKWTPEFEHALRTVAPFVGANATHAWSACIGFAGSHVYATNNVAIIRVPLSKSLKAPAMMPVWGWEFVSSRTDGLAKWSITDTAIWFAWSWGAAVRIRQIEGQWPAETAQRALAGAALGPAAPQPLTDAYRAAANTVAGLLGAGEALCLGRFCVQGRAGGASHVAIDEPFTSNDDSDGDIGPGEDWQTWWDPDILLPVLGVAQAFSVQSWPKPALFTGAGGIEGVLMGRKAPEMPPEELAVSNAVVTS